jgi:DNA-binding transcriptional LysR family regulator
MRETLRRISSRSRMRVSVSLALTNVETPADCGIGAAEDLADTWLPEVLRCFGRQYPAVGVELEIGIGTTLFKMLQTRELDLVVMDRLRVGDYGRSPWYGPFRQTLRSRRYCRWRSSQNHVPTARQRFGRWHEPQDGGISPAQVRVWPGPGRLHGWIGRDATAEARDQTRSLRSW